MTIKPKWRPILFRGDMIRALLNTKVGVWPAEPIDPTKPWKWQTRRLVKPQPGDMFTHRFPSGPDKDFDWIWWNGVAPMAGAKNRFGRPGDCLWVKETFGFWCHSIESVGVEYAAGGDDMIVDFPDKLGMPSLEVQCQKKIGGGRRKRPSIFMPRWASRLDVELMGVRVHRIREITYGDALAEGIPLASGQWYDNGQPKLTSEIDDYLDLFKEINGEESTDKNVWVWCLELKRLK